MSAPRAQGQFDKCWEEMVLRLAIASIVIASLFGCASKEGIRLPISKPTQEDVGDFNRRNAQASNPTSASRATPNTSPNSDAVKTTLIPDVQGPKIIVVGNAMALTVFDEPTLNQRYDNYLKQLGSKAPAFSREWYLATSAGQTSAKYSGVTGIYTRFYRAEIPKDLVRQIGFASAFGTFMAGTSADLVVAQVIPGYGAWITHVLCSEKDPNYSACESHYRRGIYQSSDGREIDGTLKLVDGGGTIDPATFKVLLDGSVGNQAQSATAQSQSAAPSRSTLPEQASVTTLQAPRDEAAKLQKLKELLDKGLITQQEYERKRKEIIDGL